MGHPFTFQKISRIVTDNSLLNLYSLSPSLFLSLDSHNLERKKENPPKADGMKGEGFT